MGIGPAHYRPSLFGCGNLGITTAVALVLGLENACAESVRASQVYPKVAHIALFHLQPDEIDVFGTLHEIVIRESRHQERFGDTASAIALHPDGYEQRGGVNIPVFVVSRLPKVKLQHDILIQIILKLTNRIATHKHTIYQHIPHIHHVVAWLERKIRIRHLRFQGDRVWNIGTDMTDARKRAAGIHHLDACLVTTRRDGEQISLRLLEHDAECVRTG